MKHLYAPWRGSYVTEDNPLHRGVQTKTCIFCDVYKKGAEQETYILKRFTHSYIMLNTFPYNPGHVLVVSYEHVDTLEVLEPEVRADVMEAISSSMAILKKVLKCDAINVGFNIGGKAAGGSVPEHVHGHVLPRWLGDTNFLLTLAETKQLSADLKEVYAKLLPHFTQL